MKKILFAVIGLFVVVLAAALFGPGLINWNNHKAEGAAWIKSLTGRDVSIDGDIEITILPTPALIVKNVGLANIEGAANPEMVRLKSLEVRIALEPLLSGQIQVETIRLIEPIIEIEVLADGRNNLNFIAAADVAGKPAAGAKNEPTDEGVAAPTERGGFKPAIQLDNFSIENGTLIYRDGKSGAVERLERITARIAAASLSGPFESSGGVTARGIAFNYDISVGEVAPGRAVPVSLAINDKPGGSKAQLSGNLLRVADEFKFKGSLKGEGNDLAGLINTAAGAGPLPGFLSQKFGFEGAVVASTEGLDIANIILSLGNVNAAGALSVTLGKAVNAALKIAVKQVNMNEWLSMPAAKAAPSPATPKAGSEVMPSSAANAVKGKDVKTTDKAGFSLPTAINGTVNLSVDSIVYQSGIIHEANADIELANGEIAINRLSAKFPGGADAAVFGFISASEGRPKFDGEIETTISDFRKLLSWLGTDQINIPGDRLRKLAVSGKISATPAQIQVSGLDVQFDSSRLTGGVTVAVRSPLAFGAGLVLDRINLDAYLPSKSAPTPDTAKPETGPVKKDGAPSLAGNHEPAPATANPLAILDVLKTFDANLMAHVKAMVYKGNNIKDIVLDGTLSGGNLELRRASVADLADASAMISGKLSGIGGIPEMKDLNIEAHAADISSLFKLADAVPPANAGKLGEVYLKGLFNGSFLKPSMNVNIKAAGAEITADGALSFLPLIGGFDGAIKAVHGNLPRLLGVFGIDYSPVEKFGGTDIAARIKADAKTVSLQGIKGNIGPLQMTGAAEAMFGDHRPRINVDLQTGEIVVDKLLPAKRSASLYRRFPGPCADPAIIPASWRPSPDNAMFHRAAATDAGRWPNDPIDFSALNGFDADIKLKAQAVTYQMYRVEKADLAATVNNGILNANRLTGYLFGGELDANAIVNATAAPRIETALNIKNMDVGKASQAVSGKAMAGGVMNLSMNLTTAGRSVANMVSALGGSGALALKQLDVREEATGTALASALNLIVGLNTLGGLPGGGGKGKGLADITGSFKIDKGVARTNDIKLVSSIGDGGAQGTVDLPNWQIDIGGEVSLSQNALTALITKKTNAPTVLPFQVRGSLDAPSVKLDTSKMPEGGIALPGGLGKSIEKKLEKKGLGGLLNKLVPGVAPEQQQQPSQQPQAQPQQQPQVQQQPQQQQPQKPKDFLKDILKGIAR